MEAQAERASSHDRILYAAKHLFARQGYLQTATAQVARQAETSESQLIKHFGSKEGLLEAIFEGVWKGLNEQVRHLTAAYPDPAKRLKALTNLMVDAMESDAELKRLMLFEGRRIRTHGATVTAGFMTAGEFDALVEDLVATLDQFDVPKAEQDELLGVLGPMRTEIVEVESPETGTGLPDAYRPAPPLG